MIHLPVPSPPLRLRTLFLCMGLLCGLLVNAQSPRLGTMGKRFWVGFNRVTGGGMPASLHINGAPGTTGTVSIPRASWSEHYTLPATGIVSVTLPTSVENTVSEVVADKGILVVADHEVSVVAVVGVYYSSEATMVLPEEALGLHYRVVSYKGVQWSDLFRSNLLVVATKDGTVVRITPSTTTSNGQPAGVPFTVHLDAGQTYQVIAGSPTTDLTGTLVEATDESGPCRPFALFNGTACAFVPDGCQSCNPLYDQAIPTPLLGKDYYTIPLGSSTHFTYRIMATANGTAVQVDGTPTYTLDAGDFVEVNGSQVQRVISANKAINVVQYHEGVLCAGNGDPSMFTLFPAEVTTNEARMMTVSPGPGAVYSISIVTRAAAVGQIMLNGTAVPLSTFFPYPGDPSMVHASINVTAGTHFVSSTQGFHAYMVCRVSGDCYVYPASRSPFVPQNTDTLYCINGPDIAFQSPVPLNNATWTSTHTGQVLATGTNVSISLAWADTIVLTGTLPGSGCAYRREYHVGQALGTPGAPVMQAMANGANSVTICQHEDVQLSMAGGFAPGWFDLSWTPAVTVSDPHGATPMARPDTDTWYRLSASGPTGCGSAVDSVLVQVVPNDLLSMQAISEQSAICAGNSTTLTMPVGRVFRTDRFEGSAANWWTISGGTVSNACGSATGSALYFNGSGTRSATTNAMDLSNGGGIRFALKIADGTAPCDNADPGEDVVVEYSTNGTNWSILGTFHENAYPQITQLSVSIPPSGPTTRIRFRQLTHSGAGQDNWVLDDVLISRNDPTGLTIQWSPTTSLSNPNAQTTLASPPLTTWYHASVGANPSCSLSDSVRVDVQPAFGILPMTDTVRCSTAPVQLQALTTGAVHAQWSWSPANAGLSATNIPDPQASPNSTTTYTVVATNDIGCSDTARVEVVVSRLTNLALQSTSPLLCHGASTNLQANITSTGPYTVQWSPSSGLSATNSPAVVATPDSTTTYTCKVTDTASGCSMSSSITVQVAGPYQLSLPPDTSVCTLLGYTFQPQHNVPGNPSYQWNNPQWLNSSTIRNPSVLVDTSATWTLTITDANGCTVSGSTTLNVAFDNLITPEHVSTCEGSSLVLDALFPGSTYVWTTMATSQTITVDQPGDYTVSITDAQLCQVVKTFVVSMNPLPTLELGPDTTICGASPYILHANSNGSVVWGGGGTGPQLSITTSGSYSAIATSTAGCQRSDQVHLILAPNPVNTLADANACINAPVTLSAGNPGASYLWSSGETTASITPAAAGNYSVTVTTQAGCQGQFSAQVQYHPLVLVELGSDTALCAGQQLVLDAGNPGHTYTWSTGASGQEITVSTDGLYSVTVSNGYCSASDQKHVVFHPLPIDQLVAHTTSCIDQPVTLDAGNPGSTYLWNTGATTATLVAAVDGNYSVLITDPNGCHATYNATVELVPYPVVDLGPDTAICNGQRLQLHSGNPGADIQWSTGETTNTIRVDRTGTYSVTVSNGYCTTVDAIHLRVDPTPDRIPTRYMITCLAEAPFEVELDAANPGSAYLWGNGATTRTFTATSYGSYPVTITNRFGCSISDEAQVIQECITSMYLPNSFTPNNDGLNDVWLPVGKHIAAMDLLVFDRWGQVVFHSTDPDHGWDGMEHGAPARNETYAYRIRWRHRDPESGMVGTEQEQLGHVQVIR